MRSERTRTVDLPRAGVLGQTLGSHGSRATAARRRAHGRRRAAPAHAPVAATRRRRSAEIEALVAEAHDLLEKAEPARARSVADLALAKDGRHVGALLARAHANADSGDFDAAIADATEALAHQPAARVGALHPRHHLPAAGRPARALAEFKRTIYIDRDFVLAHFNLANLYRAQGALDDACREYENALRALYLSPNGEWTAFLGGFKPDLLAKTCERSLIECRKGSTRR